MFRDTCQTFTATAPTGAIHILRPARPAAVAPNLVAHAAAGRGFWEMLCEEVGESVAVLGGPKAQSVDHVHKPVRPLVPLRQFELSHQLAPAEDVTQVEFPRPPLQRQGRVYVRV